MRSSIHLGNVLGIPIGINPSWLVIFFLITVSLAAYYFPANYPPEEFGWPVGLYWVLGVLTSLLFFGSVLAHELTHSLIARRSGIPVKGITLFIFGGVAHISREANRPRTEIIMAAAGPASSLGMAGVFAFIWWLSSLGISDPLAALAQWLARINLLLAVFNMVPGFPLDGGRVFRSVIWGLSGNYRRATRVAALAGQIIGYLFIFGGIGLALTGDWVSGLWLALIGWFLDNAASSSYRQSLLRDALQGLNASDVMARECPSIPPDLTLRELVQKHILPTNHRSFFVAGPDRLEGVVTLGQVKGVPRGRWGSTTVAQAMLPAHRLKVVRAEDEAVTALERMDEEEMAEMPVVRGEVVVGVVSREELLRVLKTRSELGM